MLNRIGPTAAPRGLLTVAVAVGAYFLAYFLRVAPTTLSDELMGSLQISATELGLLAAAYNYVTMAMQIPAGAMVDRFGVGRVISAGCMSAALGCAMFALAHGFGLAALGRLLIGLGCSVLFIGMLKVMAMVYEPDRFATVTGVGMVLGASGSVLAGGPLAYANTLLSWRSTSMLCAVGCLAAAVTSWCLLCRLAPKAHLTGQETAERAPAPSIRAGLVSVLAEIQRLLALRPIWMSALINLGISGSFMSFTGLWAVPYLVHGLGYSVVQASAHVSVYFVAFAVACLLIGRLSDALKSRATLVWVGSLVYLLALVSLQQQVEPSAATTYAIFIALGLSASAFTLTWTIAKEAVAPESSGLAMAIVNTGGFLGSALLQPAAGLVMDHLWQGVLVDGLRVYGPLEYRACLGLHALAAFIGLAAAIWMWQPAPRQQPDRLADDPHPSFRPHPDDPELFS